MSAMDYRWYRGRIGTGIAAAILGCGLAAAQTNRVQPCDAPPRGVEPTPAQVRLPESGDQVATNAPKVSDKTPKRIHAFVTGKVQGVGFRAFTSSAVETLDLKVTGWVRNLSDGRVELVAEGPATDLERLMAKVAKGPGASRVDAVDRKEEPYTGEFKQFKITQ